MAVYLCDVWVPGSDQLILLTGLKYWKPWKMHMNWPTLSWDSALGTAWCSCKLFQKINWTTFLQRHCWHHKSNFSQPFFLICHWTADCISLNKTAVTWLDVFAQWCFNNIYCLPTRLLSFNLEKDCHTKLALTVNQHVSDCCNGVTQGLLILWCQVHSNTNGIKVYSSGTVHKIWLRQSLK